MNNSTFVKHEPCPKCNSKDNLGVWSDGHKWCFGCGYYVSPTGVPVEIAIRKYYPLPRTDNKVIFPADSVLNIPEHIREWLTKYHVDKVTAAKYGIRWSAANQTLIFPIFDDDRKLIMYQERYFTSVGPKYHSVGKLDNYIPVFGNDDKAKSVVIVEDYVSAINVARVMPCVPLFGSHLSKETATRLSTRFNTLILWLDRDMTRKVMNYIEMYSTLFDETCAINTTLDPKEYEEHEIFEQVWGNFDVEC